MTNSIGIGSDGVDMDVGVLFEPVKIAGLEVRNRLVMAPMTRSHSPNGIPGQNVVDISLAAYAAEGVVTLNLISLPSGPALGVKSDDYQSEKWIDFVAAMLDAHFSALTAAPE